MKNRHNRRHDQRDNSNSHELDVFDSAAGPDDPDQIIGILVAAHDTTPPSRDDAVTIPDSTVSGNVEATAPAPLMEAEGIFHVDDDHDAHLQAPHLPGESPSDEPVEAHSFALPDDESTTAISKTMDRASTGVAATPVIEYQDGDDLLLNSPRHDVGADRVGADDSAQDDSVGEDRATDKSDPKLLETFHDANRPETSFDGSNVGVGGSAAVDNQIDDVSIDGVSTGLESMDRASSGVSASDGSDAPPEYQDGDTLDVRSTGVDPSARGDDTNDHVGAFNATGGAPAPGAVQATPWADGQVTSYLKIPDVAGESVVAFHDGNGTAAPFDGSDVGVGTSAPGNDRVYDVMIDQVSFDDAGHDGDDDAGYDEGNVATGGRDEPHRPAEANEILASPEVYVHEPSVAQHDADPLGFFEAWPTRLSDPAEPLEPADDGDGFTANNDLWL